jgi:hypothetical protein
MIYLGTIMDHLLEDRILLPTLYMMINHTYDNSLRTLSISSYTLTIKPSVHSPLYGEEGDYKPLIVINNIL